MSEVQKNWRNLIGCVARFPIGGWFNSNQSDSSLETRDQYDLESIWSYY